MQMNMLNKNNGDSMNLSINKNNVLIKREYVLNFKWKKLREH